MSVTDDFNRADEDLEASSNWILQDGTAGSIRIVSNTARTRNKDNWYSYRYAVDQGADAYIQAHQMYFSSQAQIDGMAVRVVDRDNWVGYTFGGTGSAGRRLSKCVAGVITDLITSQGVSGEWIKVEADGTTVKLFEGGTGASPSWTQVGSDQTISEHSTEASQGFIGYSSSYGEFWDDFEAGALTSGGSTGTASGTLSVITGAASGATTVPAFSGTASGLLSAISGNATGTATAPGSTATAAGVLSQITGSAAGATIPPVFSATASGQLTAITGLAAGIVDNPGFSATATGILSAITGSASGQVVNAGIVGTGAGVLSQITANATGNTTAPEFTATGAGVLQNITGSASGEFLDTAITGTGAGILAQIFGNASGTFYTDDSIGTGAGILSQIFGSATGIIVNPDTGENINLQIVWIDNKKELEFLAHTRSMELYD